VPEIDREGGQRGLAGQRIDQRLQGLADHRRLLADLLHHEMPVIAFAHHGTGERRRPGRPLDPLPDGALQAACRQIMKNDPRTTCHSF
jgi:hypothetical protein